MEKNIIKKIQEGLSVYIYLSVYPFHQTIFYYPEKRIRNKIRWGVTVQVNLYVAIKEKYEELSHIIYALERSRGQISQILMCGVQSLILFLQGPCCCLQFLKKNHVSCFHVNTMMSRSFVLIYFWFYHLLIIINLGGGCFRSNPHTFITDLNLVC